jgi:hypothetical protein
MAYLSDGQIMSRTNNEAIELPEQVARDVVEGIEAQSVVASLAKRVPMGSLTHLTPVVNSLPDAYWLTGDTSLKTTTVVDFDGVQLVAVPLAALVVIPDDFQADSTVNIGGEVVSLLQDAFAKKIDGAVMFGTNKPAAWTSPSLYDGAAAVGNYSELAASDTDYAQGVANAAKLVAQDGYNVNGIAYDNALKWDIAASRTTDGIPLNNLTDPFFGLKQAESTNGAWSKSNARALVGDWSKVLFGVRQQFTATLHTDAVITDTNGVVTYNAMQQDSKILRVVGRFAYAVALPATWLNATSSRFPMAIVTNDNSVGS